MTLTIDLPDNILARLRADAEAQGRDAAALAAARLAAFYAPEPPIIEENSPEEDAAITAALDGPFHPFEPDTAHAKLLRRFGRETALAKRRSE
jgi:hypothetical protein